LASKALEVIILDIFLPIMDGEAIIDYAFKFFVLFAYPFSTIFVIGWRAEIYVKLGYVQL
jgi:hypothetical protein